MKKWYFLFLSISPVFFEVQRCTIPHFEALDQLFWPLAWFLTLGSIIFAVWSKIFVHFFLLTLYLTTWKKLNECLIVICNCPLPLPPCYFEFRNCPIQEIISQQSYLSQHHKSTKLVAKFQISMCGTYDMDTGSSCYTFKVVKLAANNEMKEKKVRRI